jgi:radical SAM superfamily enzyme
MSDITTEKKPRAKRTVRSSEVVTKSALALPLQQRVDLVETLRVSIDMEVEGLKAAADQAEKIAKRS